MCCNLSNEQNSAASTKKSNVCWHITGRKQITAHNTKKPDENGREITLWIICAWPVSFSGLQGIQTRSFHFLLSCRYFHFYMYTYILFKCTCTLFFKLFKLGAKERLDLNSWMNHMHKPSQKNHVDNKINKTKQKRG